jgi:type 1 fimbria pilin
VNRFVLSSVIAAVLASPVAFAGTSTELRVKGTITPSACQMSLASNGDVDFGKILPTHFVAGQDLHLDAKSVGLTVKCDNGPAKFWLKASDQATASAADTGTASYGLGMNGDKPIGYYTLGFAATGTEHEYVLKSTDGGASWGTPMNEAMVPFEHDGGVFAFASSATATEPEAIQTFSTNLTVAPVLSKDPDVSEEVAIAGHATIEIFY